MSFRPQKPVNLSVVMRKVKSVSPNCHPSLQHYFSVSLFLCLFFLGGGGGGGGGGGAAVKPKGSSGSEQNKLT